MYGRWARLGLLTALLLITAACGGGGGSAASTTEGTSTTHGSATSTTGGSTTTSTTLSPNDQLRQTVVDLLEKRNEILMHPDPNRVTEWLSPDCSCFQFEHDLVANLAAKGQHYAGKDAVILGDRVSDADPQTPTITAVLRRDGFGVADSQGMTVSTVPALDPTGLNVIIGKRDGDWRVLSLRILDQLSPETRDQIVAEGLP